MIEDDAFCINEVIKSHALFIKQANLLMQDLPDFVPRDVALQARLFVRRNPKCTNNVRRILVDKRMINVWANLKSALKKATTSRTRGIEPSYSFLTYQWEGFASQIVVSLAHKGGMIPAENPTKIKERRRGAGVKAKGISGDIHRLINKLNHHKSGDATISDLKVDDLLKLCAKSSDPVIADTGNYSLSILRRSEYLHEGLQEKVPTSLTPSLIQILTALQERIDADEALRLFDPIEPPTLMGRYDKDSQHRLLERSLAQLLVSYLDCVYPSVLSTLENVAFNYRDNSPDAQTPQSVVDRLKELYPRQLLKNPV